MIPGAGMNPKQLKQMQRAMKQMGMDMKDVKGATEVIIKFKDKEIVINNPKVNLMDFMGQKTYQITGKPKERKFEAELEIPEEDVELVSAQTGASKEDAIKALKDTDGDLAEAIMRLS
ncbi:MULTISPECIES: nascent polypeptide-associated complex protein [Methanobacterium]|jgi:nascent polypeptide-associated complex subunit alpha|uniref:Nascent polypeptide-associated complex protein n=1 Tax=Methanobacterium veterum TaxID=408577 RepID=A0A9E5A3R0_9EURY|nr:MULTISPECIES: nascent polypeptide-associated complex protein [Methanobacterium]MCZ3367460.1 nascent polypeptide-associated complex protein [Methanobacterium veterum]MCZ3373392.1 nascent polypeptide-associated complex protein [Methanobacterium veterum]